ncbi:MAG TPA: ribonuclease HII [Anaerolineales bacterium]|nr:ribonuclease HII [Anaerolineales bacterium]
MRRASPPPNAPSFVLEEQFRLQGLVAPAGVDEAGRGAWAGPVTAGAVIFPPPSPALFQALQAVRDSKKMSPVARERQVAVIHTWAVACAVGSASAQEVDDLGILPATRLAMCRAVQALPLPADCLVVDAVSLHKECALPCQAVYFGESWSFAIAAASILAKTSRDAYMSALAQQYPHYHFEQNKGYGTAQHQQALIANGICPEHRTTYQPVRVVFSKQNNTSSTPDQLALKFTN